MSDPLRPVYTERASKGTAVQQPSLVGRDARVLLLGCVSEKGPAAVAAQDLYVSTLFRLRRAFAETLGSPWFILSAKHGLVRPDEMLAPYDVRLSNLSAADRRAWGDRVFAQLHAAVAPLPGRVFEFHAGSHYVEAVKPHLEKVGAVVVWPLQGLRLGEQLHWYKHFLKAHGGG